MNNIVEVLKTHLDKYPLMQEEDIYKLAYQFYYGPSHFINDKEKAFNYLLEEAKEIKQNYIEVVDLGGYARVSLISNNEFLVSLFDAFYLSAKESDKDIDGFVKILDICTSYLKENSELYDSFIIFLNKMKELNYPAISHSEIYRKNYSPHYRLINKKFLKDLEQFI